MLIASFALTVFQDSHSTSAAANATKARSKSVFIVERAHTRSESKMRENNCAITGLLAYLTLCTTESCDGELFSFSVPRNLIPMHACACEVVCCLVITVCRNYTPYVDTPCRQRILLSNSYTIDTLALWLHSRITSKSSNATHIILVPSHNHVSIHAPVSAPAVL